MLPRKKGMGFDFKFKKISLKQAFLLFNKMVNVIETLDKDVVFLPLSETASCKLEHVRHGA